LRVSLKLFIVPPGLRYKIKEFEAHYKIADRTPILICGPSGVGKSMFLHIFQQLYRAEHGQKCPIATVNCSHFHGDLARSELFGHLRGAFTGAVQNKDGWIKRADGGVLILEEIGDLPEESQAKLLTFIETGEFHRVGSVCIEKANVQIVAATNKPDQLRQDFHYRFFPFHVPPLHERRQDVLYYLTAAFPELIKSLRPWEVLTLLTFNWPGNVREVEKIGRLLKRRKLIIHTDPFFELLEDAIQLLQTKLSPPKINRARQQVTSRDNRSGLDSLDLKYSSLAENKTVTFSTHLENNGINVSTLNAILKQYRISLSLHDKSAIFEDVPDHELDLKPAPDKQLNITVLKEIKAFQEAFNGLMAFCSLFWLNDKSDTNLLDIDQPLTKKPLNNPHHFFAQSNQNQDLFNALSTLINRRDQEDSQPDNDFLNMSRDQLLKTYYQGLLKLTGGNQTKAARKAGVRYTTFRDYLKKYGIT